MWARLDARTTTRSADALFGIIPRIFGWGPRLSRSQPLDRNHGAADTEHRRKTFLATFWAGLGLAMPTLTLEELLCSAFLRCGSSGM